MPITLSNLKLDDIDEPSAFVGDRCDGVQVSVPVEDVKKRQREKLIEQLKAGK